MQIFLGNGPGGASIADLTAATGVKRQSLFNAIGDKRRFFVRSLLEYDAENRQAALENYRAFLERMIEHGKVRGEISDPESFTLRPSLRRQQAAAASGRPP